MTRLTFLGTANAFGHDGRRRSHYLLEGTYNGLIDVSYDALPGLRSLSLTISDIDFIFLSHLHPDHYMGIPQMALEDYYALKSGKKVEVFGPIGTRELLSQVTELIFNQEIAEHLSELFNFTEFGPLEDVSYRAGKIKTLPAQHSGNARMQIITFENKKIGYTGDTEFLPNELEKLLDADITITEASSAFHKIPGHTTLQDLLDADFPEDKRIYISHVGGDVVAEHDKIRPPLFLAHDGLVVDL